MGGATAHAIRSVSSVLIAKESSMTEIFALMWIADIAGSISVVGIVTLIMLAGSSVVALFAAIEEDKSCVSEISMMWWKCARWMLIPIAIASICPSSTTIKILAAAKAGELVAHTETGNKAIQAANAILDEIISKQTKKESK